MALLQRDQFGIVETRILYDDHTDECHIVRTQDAEPVLEACKALRNANWDGYNGDRSYRATHIIPITVLEQMMREGVNPFDSSQDREVTRRINDPALDGFRCYERRAHGGHVIVKA